MRKEEIKYWIEDHKKEIIIGGIGVATGVALSIGGYRLWTKVINSTTGMCKLRYGFTDDKKYYKIAIYPCRRISKNPLGAYCIQTIDETREFINEILNDIKEVSV